MTQKLPIHTLKQIPRNSIKEFLKSVPEKITDSKQYTRDYVSTVLKEERKENLSEENWELLKSYTESLYNFLPRIQKCRTTISLKLLEQFSRVFGEMSEREFEKLCEKENVRYVLKYANEKNLEKLIGLCKNPEDFVTVCECIYINGELGIHSQGSSVLEEMLKDILTSGKTEKTERREIRYFQKRAQEFLTPREVNNTSSQGEIRKDISMYVRYGHTVNYPEIAEAIIVFIQEYKKKFGKNTFIQNISIIPRYIDKTPSEGVFKDSHTQFYPVTGNAFTKALHDESIALFLSHSHNSRDSENSPNVISGGMKQAARKEDIILPFELETSYQKKGDITETMTIQELYASMFEVLQSVEERMIKK